MRSKFAALGAGILLAVVCIGATTGGFPSRPRFQSLGVGVSAPAGVGDVELSDDLTVAGNVTVNGPGVISGNGSGLTSLNAAVLTGEVSYSSLPVSTSVLGSSFDTTSASFADTGLVLNIPIAGEYYLDLLIFLCQEIQPGGGGFITRITHTGNVTSTPLSRKAGWATGTSINSLLFSSASPFDALTLVDADMAGKVCSSNTFSVLHLEGPVSLFGASTIRVQGAQQTGDANFSRMMARSRLSIWKY